MTSFVVEHDSPLTAWGQVQRDLRRRVERREFAPGSRIPSEAELVAHYGVSRVTVRRAIEALATDGLLRTRRGSGTFVTEGTDMLRYDVDLLRPWREQLLATGHVARSQLVETTEHAVIPGELRRDVEYDSPDDVRFGLHVQHVDQVAIAVTESWMPAPTPKSARSALVSATSSVRIAFASPAQAELLGSYRDAALLEVTTCSRLRETGQLVELARTSWLAGRVRFTYGRSLTLANIDMSELLDAGVTGAR
ncbi:GntR family transcriptional regulator [Subtercola lobariae]|uniref:GntR family transcriptional regulator n=1 Tax=Subtercola lobariae TaxID=1588641 RepID=A0A917BC78_9MICO|nr:GntR family transcriptional regulator [Subtercola lobariae]GGF31405.1 GntR family transcriptional regulator [Subtercola lobariae]